MLKKNSCSLFVSFQLDYFGLASTVYTILSGSYLKLGRDSKAGGRHFPEGSFKRWWDKALWTDFFAEFLNIESSEALPDLRAWRQRMAEALVEKNKDKFADAIAQLNRK